MTQPFIQSLRASDFHILPGFEEHVMSDGRILVPSGYHGFVIYGPYWDRPAGLYVVQTQIEVLDETVALGTLELCDNGVVLASTALTSNTVLVAQIEPVSGLEVRVKASGVPFTLGEISVIQIASNTMESTVNRAGAAIEALNAVDTTLKTYEGEAAGAMAVAAAANGIDPSYDLLWNAVTNGAAPGLVARLLEDMSFGDAFETWLKARARLTVYDAWGPHISGNAAQLLGLGLDLAGLRLATTDLHSVFAQYARQIGLPHAADLLSAIPDADHQAGTPDDWFAELERVQGGFSKLCALAGHAATTCPFTGRTISSQHCFTVPSNELKQVFLFYRFESTEPFYIVVGGFSGSKMFLYLPNRNVILRLSAPLFEWGEPQGAVDQFTRLVMPQAVAAARYLSAATEPAALVGTMDNVGHFFWNEASGVVKYHDLNLLAEVKQGILHRFAYIDPFRLIPADAIPVRHVTRSEEELFLLAMDRSLFCFRPIDAHVEATVADRIRQVAVDAASPEARRTVAEAKACEGVLWVALRAHNKVWVNQVDGLAAVIADAARDKRALAVFVDGTPDCKPYYDELAARMPENVRIYPGIQIDMYETLLWAYDVDAYVATIGSGLPFVTWLAGKPGVAHSETHHLDQMSFWGDVRRGVPTPVTPRADQVHNIGNGAYCNYEIDPEVMVALFRSAINPVLA
jgi:hypothetical protein